MSPSLSHFSSLSRTSSLSNLRLPDRSSSPKAQLPADRDVFKWTPLRNINNDIFSSKLSQPSTSGASVLGSPTVLAANGLICIGTERGTILVYDFKQTLKCICGSDSSGVPYPFFMCSDILTLNSPQANTVGPVSSLALSHDHTYVASGHTTGHIQLFDLHKPQVPARFVAPPPLAAIVSGRKEGHLLGSRIVSIGFVAERHTAIVSADEHGLAFSHSLGKLLFVEASDILRILGKYPKEVVASFHPSTSTTQNQPVPTTPSRGRKTRYTVLAMMALPLGTSPHPTDGYNIIALLTPAKLVIVGLKPTPKTWFKRPRDEAQESASWSKAKWRGTLVWFPSVSTSANGKVVNGNGVLHAGDVSTPVLAYSWGATLHLISVSVSRVKQITHNPRSGRAIEVEVGNIVVEDKGKWTSDDTILAMQRLNANVGSFIPAPKPNVPRIYQSHSTATRHFDSRHIRCI